MFARGYRQETISMFSEWSRLKIESVCGLVPQLYTLFVYTATDTDHPEIARSSLFEYSKFRIFLGHKV